MTGIILIPFRQGSKGLKDKALATLGGQTLLARTVQVARAGLPGNWPLLLYTDYPDTRLGDLAPYRLKRPASKDGETTEEALAGAVRAFSGQMPDVTAFFTVNTPVCRVEWVRQCYESMRASWPGVDSSFVVEPTRKQLWQRRKYYRLGSVWAELTHHVYGPRQTTPPTAYIEHTGVCCLTKTACLVAGTRIGPTVEPVVVDHPHISLDIHTAPDLEYANWLYSKGRI